MVNSTIHHCLFWVETTRNQKFSAILKRSNVNVLLELILFIWTKGFQAHLRICVNANVCVFERTYESRLFCALYMVYLGALLAGIAKTATGKAWYERKTLGQLGLVCVWMIGHKCSFQNSHFLDSGCKNLQTVLRHWRQTSDYLSRNWMYYRYLELRFC